MSPPPVTVVTIPDAAVVAELESTGIDGDQLVRVCIGPALQLILSTDTADQVADALIDITAELVDRPAVWPAIPQQVTG